MRPGLESYDAFTKILTEANIGECLLGRSDIALAYLVHLSGRGSFIKDGKLSFDDPLNQGTKSLKLVADWAQQGLIPKNAGYAPMVALFPKSDGCISQALRCPALSLTSWPCFQSARSGEGFSIPRCYGSAPRLFGILQDAEMTYEE